MAIVMVLVSYTVMSKSSTNQVDLCHLDSSLAGVSKSKLRRISGIACASVPSLTQTLSQTTQQKLITLLCPIITQPISETMPIFPHCRPREPSYRTILITWARTGRSIGTAWILEDLIRLVPKQIALEISSTAQMLTSTTSETSLQHNRLSKITKLKNLMQVNFSVSEVSSKSILMMLLRLWYLPKHNGAL